MDFIACGRELAFVNEVRKTLPGHPVKRAAESAISLRLQISSTLALRSTARFWPKSTARPCARLSVFNSVVAILTGRSADGVLPLKVPQGEDGPDTSPTGCGPWSDATSSDGVESGCVFPVFGEKPDRYEDGFDGARRIQACSVAA